MAIRAVVFDLFDTLVDLLAETTPVEEFQGRRIPRSFRRLHAELDGHSTVDFETFVRAMIDLDRGFRRTHYGEGIELPSTERFAGLCRHLEIDAPELPEALAGLHMDSLRRQVSPVDHHPGILSSLRERVRIGLCSNFSHSPTALRILDESSLREYFDAIVISDEVGIRKPRPEIFSAVLDALDVEAAQVLHVGDSLSADVAGAAALGIRTAWLTRRVADPDAALAAYEGPRPDWQIADLTELGAVLERSGKAALDGTG